MKKIYITLLIILTYSRLGFAQITVPAPYCAITPAGTPVITQIDFNTLSNNSPFTGGYAYYNTGANNTTILNPGATYTFSYTNNTGQDVNAVLWIDYNGDQTFQSSEGTQIALENGPGSSCINGNGNTTVNVPITIPASATLGITRMRFRIRLTCNPNNTTLPCLAGGSGQCKDFDVTIANPGPAVTTIPIASYANTDQDTVWIGSPSTIVNTSNGAAKSYWDILGFNATNKFGTYNAWPETRQQKNSEGINDDFIDTTNNAVNFSYTFPQRGWYRLKVVALNRFGFDTYIDTIYVDTPSAPPIADFFADRRVVGQFDFASFYDLSTNGPTSWKWTINPPFYNPNVFPFNSFSPSDDVRNPNLTAFEGGLFEICLIASNARGSDTVCKPNYINIIAGFEVCRGQSTAKDTISTDNNGSAKLYSFGGVYSPPLIGACGKGFTIAPCADTVILNLERFKMRVIGPGQADSVRIRQGSRTGPILARFGGATVPSNVSRRVVVPGGIAYIEVALNANTTVPGDTGFVFRWESNLASYPKPTAGLDVPDTIYSGYTQRFTNRSTGTKMSFKWDTNGDGNFGLDNPTADLDSITENPTRTFTVFAPYTANVCVVASNCKGSDTACKQVAFLPVSTLPKADFTVDRISGFTTDKFSFRDLTTNGPNEWQWRFVPNNVAYVDGTNENSQNPVVILNSASNYTVTLVAGNAIGSDSIVKTSYVTAIAFLTPGCSGCPQVGGQPILPSTVDIGISRVQVGDIDTATALQTPIYTALFDLKQQTVYRGVSYTVRTHRLTANDPMSTRVWIDFNRNTVFGDSQSETVVSEDGEFKIVTEGTFRVPDQAPTGNTRMRVGITYGNTSINYLVASLGCFEDYGIVVGIDDVKPTVKLLGNALEKVEVNKPYTEKGVLALDNLEGDISNRYEVYGFIDISKVGYYTLKYIVRDLYGNVSDTAYRTVQVEVNQTGPSIALVGQDTVRMEVYNGYVEQGATAQNNLGQNITNQIVQTGSVDTSKLGTYTLVYTITDQFGFSATTRRRVIVHDTTRPVISTISGQTTIEHQINTAYVDPILVQDNYWSNLQAVRTGLINVNLPGTYSLTYNSVDGSGNQAATLQVNVVVRDLVAPQIRLRGENPLVVDVNTPLNDPWVDASDNYYPSVIVTTSGSVLTGELGEYPITYTATDGAGNQSSVTRLVRVVDRIAPQISILGPNPIEHIRFTPYTEDLNNVRITDNYYLEDTLKKPGYLRIDYSKFDPSRPGLQIVTLRVTDPSGNRSIEETRFVRVVEFTSLNEFGENGKFRLFPNPTKDRVTITANTNIGIETYTVLDVLGRIVLQAKPTDSTQTTIDLGQLQNGIYMVVLRDKEGKEATQKVVKE